jgi:hypothetical protein
MGACKFKDPRLIQEKITDFGVRVGEIVHHLRSSLNHLVYDLGDGIYNRRTEFPIFLSRKKFKTAGGPSKIQFVRPDTAKTLIVRAQPYHQLRSNNPLWRVHTLDIIDKHHVLVVVSGNIGFHRELPSGEIDPIPSAFATLKDGAILKANLRQAPAKTEMDFRAQVVFPKIERIKSEPIVSCLTQAPSSYADCSRRSRHSFDCTLSVVLHSLFP